MASSSLNDESCTQVLAALSSLGLEAIPHHHHAPVKTVAEQATECATLAGTSHRLLKNLLCKDKKKGYFLITLPAESTLNNKALGDAIATATGGGKLSLRLASGEVLASVLKVESGSVSPLAMMFDTEHAVTFVMDAALMQTDGLSLMMHPCNCNQSMVLTPSELERFLGHFEVAPLLLDLTSASAAAAATTSATSSASPSKTNAPKEKQVKQKPAKKNKVVSTSKSKEGLTVTKSENFPDWYTEVITKSGMLDYYDISGCYILRPWSYFIWEGITTFLDAKFKSLGVQNCYFPMFVSAEKLMKEEEHLEGFAPEVAWVTKYGTTDLEKPIAVRPTSETIMYPAFKNWIRSHRDLPLKLNQWNNVVRWEFKNPTPFLRTREFLWQEGHTAHATKEEADEEVTAILDFYVACYRDILAVPMIKGLKTVKEKFAGADYTTTIEGFIPATGRGIQAATSHALGQNFGKMFGISAEGQTAGSKIIPYQNSWGFTTRSIGIMVMTHGDDKGLVLPPVIAPIQVVVVPIPYTEGLDSAALYAYAATLVTALKTAGIRVEYDDRSLYTPGWKYHHWELKGVPLRLEVGPKDFEKQSVRFVRRDTGVKVDVAAHDVPTTVTSCLATIQIDLYDKALDTMESCIVTVTDWEAFTPALKKGQMILTPFCNETVWEDAVKDKSKAESLAGAEEAETTATSMGAKSLCMPFRNNEDPMTPGTLCFISGKPATKWVLWGRSY